MWRNKPRDGVRNKTLLLSNCESNKRLLQKVGEISKKGCKHFGPPREQFTLKARLVHPCSWCMFLRMQVVIL